MEGRVREPGRSSSRRWCRLPRVRRGRDSSDGRGCTVEVLADRQRLMSSTSVCATSSGREVLGEGLLDAPPGVRRVGRSLGTATVTARSRRAGSGSALCLQRGPHAPWWKQRDPSSEALGEAAVEDRLRLCVAVPGGQMGEDDLLVLEQLARSMTSSRWMWPLSRAAATPTRSSRKVTSIRSSRAFRGLLPFTASMSVSPLNAPRRSRSSRGSADRPCAPRRSPAKATHPASARRCLLDQMDQVRQGTRCSARAARATRPCPDPVRCRGLRGRRAQFGAVEPPPDCDRSSKASDLRARRMSGVPSSTSDRVAQWAATASMIDVAVAEEDGAPGDRPGGQTPRSATSMPGSRCRSQPSNGDGVHSDARELSAGRIAGARSGPLQAIVMAGQPASMLRATGGFHSAPVSPPDVPALCRLCTRHCRRGRQERSR